MFGSREPQPLLGQAGSAAVVGAVQGDGTDQGEADVLKHAVGGDRRCRRSAPRRPARSGAPPSPRPMPVWRSKALGGFQRHRPRGVRARLDDRTVTLNSAMCMLGSRSCCTYSSSRPDEIGLLILARPDLGSCLPRSRCGPSSSRLISLVLGRGRSRARAPARQPAVSGSFSVAMRLRSADSSRRLALQVLLHRAALSRKPACRPDSSAESGRGRGEQDGCGDQDLHHTLSRHRLDSFQRHWSSTGSGT